MATKYQAKPVVIAFGSITTSYTPVTAAGFTVYQLVIANSTNQNVQVSFDGVNDAIFVPTASNSQFFSIPSGRNVSFPATLFIKASVAPGSGAVVVQYVGWDPSATAGDWS